MQGEIPNGSSSISGNFTIDEAKDLANILKAGALPAPNYDCRRRSNWPDTRQSCSEARGDFNCGWIDCSDFVHGCLLCKRRNHSECCFCSLIFFFILGILAQLGAAFTLAGAAGIVLTIGMSIDANVLIFERIKEELRTGVGLKQAISSGYQKAYWSIFDANVTTFITGALLYILGHGSC